MMRTVIDDVVLTSLSEILQYIQRDWDFMTNEKCVPVQIALKLLDSSSLGLANRSEQFQQTHQELQRSLKAIVNGRETDTVI
jgi:exocyst complex component 4